MRQLINQALKACLAVRCQGSIIREQQLAYEHLKVLVLARSLAMLKSLPSAFVRMYTPSEQSAKAYWSNIEKKIPNRVGARTQPSFTHLLTGKASEVAPSNETVLCMYTWKAVMMAMRFGRQPIF